MSSSTDVPAPSSTDGVAEIADALFAWLDRGERMAPNKRSLLELAAGKLAHAADVEDALDRLSSAVEELERAVRRKPVK